MDQAAELARAKWLLRFAALFLISSCFTFGELYYLAWGKVIDARLVQTRKVSQGRGGEGLGVEYSFLDPDSPDGGSRTERDTVSADSILPGAGQLIAVQYIPGKPGSSRLAGHRNMGRVYIFLGLLAVVAFFVVRILREANEPVQGRKPSVRSR